MSLPILIQDDRTFQELMDEARTVIPLWAPQWTDHNYHDPGITFLEMFAWLTEMQLFSLDVVSQKILFKYLSLLGIKLAPPTASRVEVQFVSTQGQPVAVPRQTLIQTETPVSGSPVKFETDSAIEVLPIELKRVISYANYQWFDVTQFNYHPRTYYHAFGQSPRAGDALYLGFDTAYDLSLLKDKILHLAVFPYDIDLPPVGDGLPGEEGLLFPLETEAAVVWEYRDSSNRWQQLEGISQGDPAAEFETKGILAVKFPAALVKGTLPQPGSGSPCTDSLVWFRCRLVNSAYEITPRIDRIIPNVVTATEGYHPGVFKVKSDGLPNMEIKVPQYPIFPGSQVVTVENKVWACVDDFDASGSSDLHYILLPFEGKLVFGNGEAGAIPRPGEEIAVSYAVSSRLKSTEGIPPVGAETIKQVSDADLAALGLTVINPYESYGGNAPESIVEAFARFKKELTIPCTAVTAADYESIVKATPGLRVARARAVLSPSSANKNFVTVVVVPYSFNKKPVSSKTFKRSVCRYLDLHRSITTYISIVDPDYVEVSVTAQVVALTGYEPELMKYRILQKLEEFLSPLPTDSNPNSWPFGRPVYYSEINELIKGVEGVDYVASVLLSAEQGTFTIEDGSVVIGPLSLVYSGDHDIEVLTPLSRECTTWKKKNS